MRARRVSAVELTTACLARIDIYNPKLNAFITVTREQALARARALDADLKAGTVHGPLHGVPVALKDNIDTAGIRTTAASSDEGEYGGAHSSLLALQQGLHRPSG